MFNHAMFLILTILLFSLPSHTTSFRSKHLHSNNKYKKDDFDDADELIRQLSNPVSTTLPQEPDIFVDGSEDGLEDVHGTADDDKFYKANIGLTEDAFFEVPSPSPIIPPSPTPTIFFDLVDFCTGPNRNCLIKQRCGVVISRGRRRLNRRGIRLLQICRRRCGVKANVC